MSGFRKRTRRITLYKRELQLDGRVADTEIETFDRARAKSPSRENSRYAGPLSFTTAEGKKVLTGAIAFVAKEVSRSIL